MRTVIAGGGMVGLTLARLLRARGEDPVVLERMPAGSYQRRPFLLGFQGFPTLEELGLLARVRSEGRDIAPGPDGRPVAVCIEVGKLLAARAVAAGVKDVVFDRGAYLYHGRVKALAEGAREGGLNF